LLGSILGDITNPTACAALGAGVIMLAAYRKLKDLDRSPQVIIWSTLGPIPVSIPCGVNFDLRIERRVAWCVVRLCFFVPMARIYTPVFVCCSFVLDLYTSGVA